MYILENVILKYISILDPIILFLFPISMFIFPNSEFTLHDTKQRIDISDPPLSIFVARYFGLDGTYLNLSIFLDPLIAHISTVWLVGPNTCVSLLYIYVYIRAPVSTVTP